MLDNGKPWFMILAVDGGGIRGIIPASVLVTLEKLLGGPIAQNVDLVVGTSTGAFIALGLTVPDGSGQPLYSASDIQGFYTDRTNDAAIFTKYDGGNTGGKPVDWLDAAFHPKYATTGVQSFAEGKFGSATLADAIAPVSCVSYLISGSSSVSGSSQALSPAPFFFRSWEAGQPGQNFTLVDAGRSSGAAPLYFPPVTVASTDGLLTGTFVDGGVAANDPALVAFAEAAEYLASKGDNLENYNVWLLSLGTGQATLAIDPGDGGVWGWLRHDALPTVLLNAPQETTDAVADILFQPADGLYYGRIQVPLQGTTPDGKPYSAAPELDDWTEDNIANLLLAGEAAGGSSLVEQTQEVLAARRARRAA